MEKVCLGDVQTINLEILSLRYFIRYPSRDSKEAIGNISLDLRREDRTKDNDFKGS